MKAPTGFMLVLALAGGLTASRLASGPAGEGRGCVSKPGRESAPAVFRYPPPPPPPVSVPETPARRPEAPPEWGTEYERLVSAVRDRLKRVESDLQEAERLLVRAALESDGGAVPQAVQDARVALLRERRRELKGELERLQAWRAGRGR